MRNATLPALHAELTTWHGARRDVIAPAGLLRMEGTRLMLDGEPVLADDGVTTPTVEHTTWETFDNGVSDKLQIPRAYLRRMKQQRPDLYAENINSWLEGDARKFLVRTLTQDPRGETDGAVVRALLTDSYRIIDNLDVLMAALEGIKQAGITPRITGDLSENRMTVRVVAEEVKALAPTLLKGYRSPFSGQTGDDNPTVFAGFVVSNSEVGNGAFAITPRLVVQVCDNGMTITKDASRSVHLGAKMGEGLVRWSSDTHEKNLALVTAQARDSVATFLDTEYMARTIARLEAEAGREIADPQKSVEALGKKLAYTEAMQADILNYFIDGGQRTSGGLMHAITAAAQNYGTDDAWFMETTAVQAMSLAV
jgi:hypothetical protein